MSRDSENSDNYNKRKDSGSFKSASDQDDSDQNYKDDDAYLN